MGLGQSLKEFILPEEDYIEASKEETAEAGIDGSAIVLFEPRNFDETEEIARHLKHKKACCINLRKMPNEYRQRIIDFLSGVVYGVNGTIKKIDTDVILCSPKNLTVGGEIDMSKEDSTEE